MHGGSKYFVDTLFDVIGMDERVRVCLKTLATPIFFFACPAVGALAVGVNEDLVSSDWINAALAGAARPGVFGSFEPDVPVRGVKGSADRVLAVRAFGAVEASPSHQRSELSDGNPVHLLGENVVDPLLQVRNLCLEAFDESAGDLPEEHARLRKRIQERHVWVRPQVLTAMVGGPCLGNHVEHCAGHLWRGEDLVVGQVRDTGEHIRVVCASEQSLHVHASSAAMSDTLITGNDVVGVKMSAISMFPNRVSSPKADRLARSP